MLQQKYPAAQLQVFDFYDPQLHTEVSIKRARKAYPPYNGTVDVKTDNLPLKSETIDMVFLIFAAHEIRNNEERASFFIQLKKALKKNGKIIVTEHQRDLPNFMAYNIGFFHFLSPSSWQTTFAAAGLSIVEKIIVNPFVTTYVLAKN